MAAKANGSRTIRYKPRHVSGGSCSPPGFSANDGIFLHKTGSAWPLQCSGESRADVGSGVREECEMLQEELGASQVLFTASPGIWCLMLLVTGAKAREQQNRGCVEVTIVILFY